MNHAYRRYVPALGFQFLTPFYDPLVAATTRERIFKRQPIAQAGVRDGERVLDLGCSTGTLAMPPMTMAFQGGGIHRDEDRAGPIGRK